MSQILNPYNVLGIAEDATNTERDQAYKALKVRLDHAKDLGSKGASLQLQQVENAYQLLKDPTRVSKFHETRTIPPDFSPFTLRLTPSKRTLETLPEPQVIYFLLDIIPDFSIAKSTNQLEPKDAPLNLTLVLDQSNSMKGARLERVKVAAAEIINQMKETDYLSVVGFNDRSTVLIEATAVENKKVMASKARMARAKGGTEILQGLRAGLKENRKYLSDDRVNHVILLTDGRTYGDEEECIQLANSATHEGISISTLGLGSDWNDEFLDELASITGGASGFIKSANSVVNFMNNQVEKLTHSFLERMKLSISTDFPIDIERVFKLKPSPQPLPNDVEAIQLGSIPNERMMSILFQMQLPANLTTGFHDIARLVVTGDVMNKNMRHVAISEIGLEVAETLEEYEEPPDNILDALGKLTLYNMQESATAALENGNFGEATARLENLATRLLDMGHEQLANETMRELNTLKQTHQLSDEGRKTIKYQTRYLISPDTSE